MELSVEEELLVDMGLVSDVMDETVEVIIEVVVVPPLTILVSKNRHPSDQSHLERKV